MKVADETWQTSDNRWLHAATKFADDFGGWGGFGRQDDEARMAYPEKQ
jgi:hypothetical protein